MEAKVQVQSSIYLDAKKDYFMIKLELTRGQYAIIDDVDADLATHKWYCGDKGYARRRISIGKGNRKMLFLHRVILQRMCSFELTKKHETDHINRNPLDNRRCNLRVATRRINIINRGLRKDNTSGFLGVSFKKSASRWQAQISVLGHAKHLGYFSTAIEAAKAYNDSAKKYNGDFAVLNEIECCKDSID